MKNLRCRIGPILLGIVCLTNADLCLVFSSTPNNRPPSSAQATSPATTTTGQKTSMEHAMTVYFGTYTRGASEGIYTSQLDLETGRLAPPRLAAETVNPSFLAVDPTGHFLYAVNSISNFNGTKSGAVSAFAIDATTNKLTPLNQQSSGGTGPCHLVVDQSGRNVLVANYSSGSVEVISIHPDGTLGEPSSFVQHHGSSVNPKRQQGPHAHSIYLDAANQFAMTADLGLDKLLVYRFDAVKGRLSPNVPPSVAVAPGSGPRHMAFHPNGRFAYVINEMGSTVTAFQYQSPAGVLETSQTITTLPKDFQGENTTAEIAIHPNGRFLYGSNRGHDSIAIFAVDSATGRLTLLGHQSTQGKTPRNFGIDPTGTFLLAANQGSDNVVVLQIDAQTGMLVPTGHSIAISSPVCVTFLPRAK